MVLFSHKWIGKLTSVFKIVSVFKFYPIYIAVFLLYLGFRVGGFDNTYINSDGKGYYAYLPATFIYNDFTFSFLSSMDDKYYKPGARCEIRKTVYGKYVNKYFAGVALLVLPFFLIAHIISVLFGFPADGYSALYQYSVLFAAVFYSWIGLLYLRKLLRLYNFSEAVILFVSVVIVFASPLIFYTISNPDWSHVYSFAAITAFVYFSKKFTIQRHNFDIFWCCVLYGIIILIRPMNGIVLFALPFIAGSLNVLKSSVLDVFKQRLMLSAGVLFSLLLVSIQFVYYYLETGHWFIWAYTEEGFNFLKPQLFEILFGYRRGLFVFTPMVFVSLFGFYKLFKRSSFEAMSLLVFIFIVVYAIASWHCWWYGMCFQLRPVTEFLSFFALLLAWLFTSNYKHVVKYLLLLLMLFFVTYNLVQVHQYRKYILHWSLMDKEKFWKVFMRTSSDYEGLFWGNGVALTDSVPQLQFEEILFEDFESYTKSTKNFEGYQSKVSQMINKKHQYSRTFRMGSVNFSDTLLFVIKAQCKVLKKIRGNSLNLVCSVDNKDGPYQYHCLKLSLIDKKPDTWYAVQKLVTISNVNNLSDSVNIYFWNPGEQSVLIDNFRVGKFILSSDSVKH